MDRALYKNKLCPICNNQLKKGKLYSYKKDKKFTKICDLNNHIYEIYMDNSFSLYYKNMRYLAIFRKNELRLDYIQFNETSLSFLNIDYLNLNSFDDIYNHIIKNIIFQ